MRVLHPSNPYYNTLSQYVDPPVDPNPSTDADSSPCSPPAPTRSQSYTPTTSQSQQRPREPAKVRTRSVGGPFGVIFERDLDLSPPNDDEIIIATVRLTNNFRRASVSDTTPSALPDRPAKRSFLRRMSTRWSGPQDGNKYTAIKLPRKDYKKYFARDKEGKYVGTEPEREWTSEELEEQFGIYQDMPLRSIPGANEYGEGDRNQPRQKVWSPRDQVFRF